MVMVMVVRLKKRLSTDFSSYQKRFTTFTCARPFSLSFLCEKEPPSPRSTLWGAFRWHDSQASIPVSAHQPVETHIISAVALSHTPLSPSFRSPSDRSTVVGHVPTVYMCSFMCTNQHRHDSTHCSLFNESQTTLSNVELISCSRKLFLVSLSNWERLRYYKCNTTLKSLYIKSR